MKDNGVIFMINRKAPKVIQINDFIDWHLAKNEIEFSPNFQRNSVWNEKAKSYLIDTILRGLPTPPIFMRQTIDINARKTSRQIIDGQQRLRTITEFYENKFCIMKSHNTTYGGKYYIDLDDEAKKQFLEYEFFVEIINEENDSIIYDMFARLNTNNAVLNKQELRNAKYWGEFKVAAYNLAGQYRDFFSEHKIFNDKQFSRMEDVEFISTLINLCLNNIQTDTPASIDKLYEKYDKSFNEFGTAKTKLDNVIAFVEEILVFFNGKSKIFCRKVYFYTLFATILHQMYGIDNFSVIRLEEYSEDNISTNIYTLCEHISSFETEFIHTLSKARTGGEDSQYLQFDKHHRTRTTSKNEREERIAILSNYIVGERND